MAGNNGGSVGVRCGFGTWMAWVQSPDFKRKKIYIKNIQGLIEDVEKS